MMRLSILLTLALALALGACRREPVDPALVENPAPLADCSDEAFIAILGGGRAVTCRGADDDPEVRDCVAAPFARRKPYAHVVAYPGKSVRLLTVFTPEKRVYQVRRWEKPTGEWVELYHCQRATEMPDEELPHFCPRPSGPEGAIQTGTACQVLERAREIRRTEARAVRGR